MKSRGQGRESEQTPGDNEGQESWVCCRPRGQSWTRLSDWATAKPAAFPPHSLSIPERLLFHSNLLPIFTFMLTSLWIYLPFSPYFFHHCWWYTLENWEIGCRGKWLDFPILMLAWDRQQECESTFSHQQFFLCVSEIQWTLNWN